MTGRDSVPVILKPDSVDFAIRYDPDTYKLTIIYNNVEPEGALNLLNEAERILKNQIERSRNG